MDEEQQVRGVVNGESGRAGSENETGQQPSHKVEMLEVEDEDSRTQRLQSLFEKLNSSSSSSGSIPMKMGISDFQFDLGERKTWAVEPPSELFSRVQAFLPQLEASNAILAQRAEADPKTIDMEYVEDNAKQYIEMNLGLGVFDMKPKGQSGDHDTEMSDSLSSSSSSLSSLNSSSSSSDSSSDSDTDSSDSDSDLDSEEILSSFLPSSLLSRTFSSGSGSSQSSSDSDGKQRATRLMRPLPRRNGSLVTQPRPSIVVLNETNQESPME
jgi:hypothetical protein